MSTLTREALYDRVWTEPVRSSPTHRPLRQQVGSGTVSEGEGPLPRRLFDEGGGRSGLVTVPAEARPL